MKRILIITTGGTIAMKRGPQVGGAVPILKGDDFLAQLPRTGVDLVFQEFTNLPSSHITVVQALELSRRIEAVLQSPDFDGVVVTHGTDTMEETAYLLDLTINSAKPVVLTGAMRTATALGYDGMANLAAAIRVAAAPEAAEYGVLVVFDDSIYAASEVQKIHSQSDSAFGAPSSGPLGRLAAERVWLQHRPAQRQYIPCSQVEELVDLITVTQGSDDRLLRHAIEDGVAGIVVAALGGGRVPPWWLPTITHAIQRRTMVCVATRCGAGTLGDEYGYVGAYHDLKRVGVVFAHNLNGPKARIKMMVALGAARRPEEIRDFFF